MMLHTKTAFICSIMEQLGYTSVEVVRASDSEGIIYWLDGLKGFHHRGTKHSVSFRDAQNFALSLLRIVKQDSTTPNLVINFWKHNLIINAEKAATIVLKAAVYSSPKIFLGEQCGVVYSHRARHVRDKHDTLYLTESKY